MKKKTIFNLHGNYINYNQHRDHKIEIFILETILENNFKNNIT